MFEMIQSGGTFMYVILCVSVLSFALFFERAGFLYLKLKLNMDKAAQKIMAHLEKSNYRGAIEECTRIEGHPLGRILKAGLLKSDKKDKEIERALEEKIMTEIPRIKAKINYLTLFANISTLLGLLGTIMGLITSFKSVSSASDAAKQEILASGISMARIMAENMSWRPSASHMRSELRSSSNHSRPAQKNWLFPNVSCTE